MEQPSHIREITPEDCEQVCEMIAELAEFEDMSDQVEITPDLLREGLFGEQPSAEGLVADYGQELVAYALFYRSFSTFVGKTGLWLEDLYVRPDFRGQGIGKQLLDAGATIARERGYGRYEWCVLDWNTKAIDFYKRSGAEVLPDWRVVRKTKL